MKRIAFYFFSLLPLLAQDVNDIYRQLQKLNNGTKVLYLAAHPDDENTRIISYLSNEKHLELAYLSLTRGDGGQNLIGSEKGAALGLIRTQELLAARGIDKAQQFFTRANDFGYSKTAKETLQKWDEDSILNDMVWVIRNFKPDVIINRFPPDKRAGHGHHTTSALLSEKAIQLAQDPKAFPHQLNYTEPHKVPYLFFNTSTWWGINLDSLYQTNPENYLRMDIGAYSQNLGASYNEIAAQSRSQHRSQGFGMALQRGSQIEYLERIIGDPKQMSMNLFNNHAPAYLSSKNWSDYQNLINKAIEELNFESPQKILPHLLDAYQMVQNWKASSLKEEKLKYLKNIILELNGIHIQLHSEHPRYVEGDTISYKLEIIQRNKNAQIALDHYQINKAIVDVHSELKYNDKLTFNGTCIAPTQLEQQAYWLRADYNSMYQIPHPLLIGKAENSYLIPVQLQLLINEQKINFEFPLEYMWVDPAFGEKHQDIQIQKPFEIKLSQEVVFPNQEGNYEIKLMVNAHQDIERHVLYWKDSEGKEHGHFFIPEMKKGAQKSMNIAIHGAHLDPNIHNLVLYDEHEQAIYTQEVIDYEHIPLMFLNKKCDLKLVPYTFKVPQDFQIAYIKGSGDYIPEALTNMGYNVHLIDLDTLNQNSLKNIKTLVIGIRAYNTLKETMYQHYKLLMDYIQEGGHMIVQYQTSRGLDHDRIWPQAMELGRDRVTEEDADVQFLNPKHVLLNAPHVIGKEQFDHWVQERGLYFAKTWDESYEALFSWHDQDETDKKGALLVSHYGKGSFIYTGISFFRQLPAGVAGAYLLFNNLIQYPLHREK